MPAILRFVEDECLPNASSKLHSSAARPLDELGGTQDAAPIEARQKRKKAGVDEHRGTLI